MPALVVVPANHPAQHEVPGGQTGHGHDDLEGGHGHRLEGKGRERGDRKRQRIE